uniref:Uncharacterized protein n=1 Tax=Rousettus aegyptiacus TaxID=9407 RepID=A0A7J8CHP9_ROUAE|nr:hypothetical protein HJG63_008931 [Rousettus aegyptiacus]
MVTSLAHQVGRWPRRRARNRERPPAPPRPRRCEPPRGAAWHVSRLAAAVRKRDATASGRGLSSPGSQRTSRTVRPRTGASPMAPGPKTLSGCFPRAEPRPCGPRCVSPLPGRLSDRAEFAPPWRFLTLLSWPANGE